MRFLTPRHALGAILALLLMLCVGMAFADTNQCWDTARNNWQRCGNDLPVLARATAGPYGDWNGGSNRLWQDVPADWAVYACEADLPVGHGDGCPTPGVYTQERFKLKAELAATAPPPPPSPPPGPTWTGQTTLSWTPPITRTDGSTLTNLASYNIYFGQAQPLAWLREVPAPATSTVVTGLAAGTWLFAVTAKDAVGMESEQSPTATVTLGPVVEPPPPPPPPVEVWAVRSNGTQATRPAYELVRNLADSAWVLGYKLGDVPVGKPCTGAKAIAGTTEYRRVAEADVALLSPTYRGRTLVAVCVRK